MLKLRIFITEYVDGNLSLNCNHMHYAFDDRFNKDDIKKDSLYYYIRDMSKIAYKEDIILNFIIR